MKKKTAPMLSGYPEFLGELKSRIRSARLAAARTVNRELILLYWDIGQAIVEKQALYRWGDSVVETLAMDLRKAFPGTAGFSGRNLWYMRRFYEIYSAPEFLQQPVAEMNIRDTHEKLQQPVAEKGARPERSRRLEVLREAVADIPWGQHVIMLDKIADDRARLYYLRVTARFGWSRNVLLNQIKAKAYERSLKAGKAHNFPIVMPEHLAEQAEEMLKSSYNLEFLGIDRVARERALEAFLIERVQQFILELGYGFCFIGRQHRLVLGRNEYFIDLLFYHRFLKALVAIELKAGRFEPEYVGKIDFYLNLLNEKEKAPDDNPSIGIILCAEKDDVVVEFSLKTKTNPIGVAEYRLTEKLPKELKGKLPSEEDLRAALLPRKTKDG